MSDTPQKTFIGSQVVHAMDYMVFAELQQAQDKAAKQLVNEAAAIPTVNVENFLAAMPARYALERGAWSEATRLSPSPLIQTWSRFPQAEVILVFACGLGAARSGDLAAARRDVERLEARTATLLGKLD